METPPQQPPLAQQTQPGPPVRPGQQPPVTPETRKAALCRNCGAPADRRFCPECGQETEDPVVPVGVFLKDVVDEFLKLDSRIVATLGPLLFRPGFLTQEFLEGRRVRYVAPFKLYFFISALYFLASAASGYDREMLRDLTAPEVGVTAAFNAGPGDPKAKPMPPARGAPKPTPTEPIPTKRGRGTRRRPAPPKPTPTEPIPTKPAPSKHVSADPREERVGKKAAEWFVAQQSLLAFLLLPLTALFLKLLYRSSGRLYLEHLLFGVHANSFFFLCSLVGLIPLVRAAGWFFDFALPIGYLALAMRRFYGQSWPVTLLKGLGLMAAYLFTMGGALLGAWLYFYYAGR